MAKVEVFDTLEDMFGAIQANRVAADLQRQPWQKELRAGDFVLRYDHEMDLFIWSELRDAAEDERAYGSPEEEVEYLQRLYREPHMEGFRAGKHYSPIVPDGEYGDLHVSTVWCKITQAQFNAARTARWPNDTQTVMEILKTEETVPPRHTIFPKYFKA